jgi:tetratricopeptide (TPR) repeat protein/predicted Ser/Thr protein kinase
VSAEGGPAAWLADEDAFAAEVRDALRDDAPPPRVPGVEGLREIGRGGQGVVYAGVQTATRRRVAVKVLLEAPGRTRTARARFERELEVAATLDDPRLVRVFSGGAAEDGRPFVVMEFVDGVRLDEAPAVLAARAASWARPGADAALALMAEVCAALDVAHRRGVIHRDLKPSNVLVDAAGRPHVVDFGLAKASGLAAEGFATTGGARLLGSLPWTSPEQAEGRNDAVDVRSDVYALGATLYHLATGAPPCPLDGDLRRALDAVVRDAPPAPTRVVPGCDRDLEAVILRALEKDPERRYATAGDMARDLRRLLAGEPIEARRETAWRALTKAAKRRRRATFALAAAAAAAAATALVVASLWRTAVDESRRAVAASERAERTLAFVLDAIGSVDPARDGPQTKLVDALDRVSTELDARFPAAADDGDARLRFRIRLRDLYLKLGRPDRALPEAEAAVALARARGAPPGGDAFRSVWNGETTRALALHQLGRSAEALALYEEAHAALAGAFGARDLDALGARNGVGLAAKRLRRFDVAAAALAEVVAGTVEPSSDPRRDKFRAAALENLAHLKEMLGVPAEAEAPQKEARDLFVAAAGAESYEALNATSNLANLYLTLGRPEAAVELLAACVGPAIERLGPRHPLALGAGHNYGVALTRAGRAQDGETVLRQVYEARRDHLGPGAPDALLTLNELCFSAANRGDLVEAERLTRLLVEGRKAHREKEPLDFLIALNNLAGFVRDAGRAAEALPLYDEAVAGADALLTPEHWTAALFRGNRARCLTDLGRCDEAEAAFKETLRVLDAKLGRDHGHTQGMRKNLDRNAEKRAASRPARE